MWPWVVSREEEEGWKESKGGWFKYYAGRMRDGECV